MKVAIKLLALLSLFLSAGALAQPVVVELFTSEGCSSCPPAEALLGELARRPGVIALAYHVDYWDDERWKDRFSMPEATQRQRGYVRRLEQSGAFTPQMVVSGDTSLVGSNRARVERAIAADRDALRMSLSQEGGSLHIYLLEAWRESMDVYLVSYLKQATATIEGGENAHRTLKHFNVVRSFKRVGTWNGRPQRLVASLAEVPRDADAVAVILQRKNQGAVAGAATMALH